MDAIQHKYIEANGVKLHAAECGNGANAVVLLHGFPETWYTWRHQMIALANAGYTAIAPDFRGYGLSDPPPEPEKATFLDLVNDLVAIVDALGFSKVFLISHDFGTRPACQFAILYPERVMGLVTLGVPYIPGPSSGFLKNLPEGFYISRWQELGRAEADFSRFDVKTVFRNIYILFSRSDLPIASQNQEIMDVVDESTTLPSWFTVEDLNTNTDLYTKSGFYNALKVPYRSINEEFKIQDPTNKVPTLIIMGGKDYSLKFPGVKDFLMSGKMKMFAPKSDITFIPEGSHFVHEQFPDEVNNLINTFIGNQSL